MVDDWTPDELRRLTRDFARSLERAAGDQCAGLYLVGSPALGDFSPRQSNVDLVAVTERPLADPPIKEHGRLNLHGRDPVVFYTTWENLRHPAIEADDRVYSGTRAVDADRMANPMTRAILAHRPVALLGPERPDVSSDPSHVRDWFTRRLPEIADRTGRLLWRRHLTRVVLEATRCAHGAMTGEVVSLRQAGELALPNASHTSHRLITDALGYREGANTSMYWGPFERKSNAVTLMTDLLRAVDDRLVG